MSDPAQQGRIGVVLGREVTPIMQQLVARFELPGPLSGEDQQAVVVALQKAFIAGARTVANGDEPTITEWELPWGDQWARDHGQDGA